jgi:hypothetical protein
MADFKYEPHSSSSEQNTLSFICPKMAKYRIYNRRQQGLAETARLILEISGAEYENVYPKVSAGVGVHYCY